MTVSRLQVGSSRGQYEVSIGRGLLAELGETAKGLVRGRTVTERARGAGGSSSGSETRSFHHVAIAPSRVGFTVMPGARSEPPTCS